MSALRQVATDYLIVRRALGSKLVGYDHLLDDFITYLDAAGATELRWRSRSAASSASA